MNCSSENLFTLEGRVPLVQALPFGLQHILAMFVANITPVILIAGACSPSIAGAQLAALVQNCMLIAGIATLVQIYSIGPLGARFPVVMGCSFTFVAALCALAGSHGYASVMGAVLVGGIFEGLLGILVRNWAKIINPIVSASVVTVIGLSLMPVGMAAFCGGFGAPDFGSGTNFTLGFISLGVCLLWTAFTRGYARLLAILAGMAAGYAAALFCGKADVNDLLAGGWFALPAVMPFGYEFDTGAIISICIIYLVSAAETIGDTSAMSNCALGRPITERELSGAIACDGFASALASVFGCPPVTSFSQNVGLASMTRVVNRFTIASGVAIMILAAFFPPLGALFSSMPQAVLGGCSLVMFGSIAVAGMQMVAGCGFTHRNVVIVSTALMLGLGLTSSAAAPLWNGMPAIVQTVFAHNEVAVTFVVVVLLNLIMPADREKA